MTSRYPCPGIFPRISRPFRTLAVLAALLAITISSAAQKKNEAYQYHIRRAPSPITIDGSVSEPAWNSAQVATDFWMVLPMDTERAKVRTDVRMAYDDKNIYLSAVCYHGGVSGPYMVESLRRDWSFGMNDNFIFFLDTFDDLTNGFTFGLNAYGAQWDGLLYEGGKNNLSWDGKWYSALKKYDDRYEFEIAIPFKTIRYKEGITRWGVNFSRLDLKTTEKSAWAPVPRNFPTAALALTGDLLWDEPPPKQSANISLIPYALGGASRDFEAGTSYRGRREIGTDAKIGIGSALNLDLTVNPDFSQVDVDQQVTNLDRYELFFPEKRQFFLENGDQFANFGYPTLRPFFSRRIGLGGVPIHFGARLSGKLNKDWRLGAMDMQTGEPDQGGVPDANFSVFALQRRIFTRSNIGVLLVNKEFQDLSDPNAPPEKGGYNRNAGVEYNLASANNLWSGKALYLKSFSSRGGDQGDAYAGNLQYFSRRWMILGQSENVSPDYTAEAGYVPRRGYHRALTTIGYTFLPKGGRVLSHGPSIESSNFFDWEGQLADYETTLNYKTTLRNQDVYTAYATTSYVRLLEPFDPTNDGRTKLSADSRHHANYWGVKFDSRPQSAFRYSYSTLHGGYYAGGTRTSITAAASYRFQPYAAVAASSTYTDLRLPQPWGHVNYWLAGPRIDVTLTTTLYFTTFIQYNEQQKNLNINTRMQWRYKPASDIFVVWTDNYLPNYLQPWQDIPGLFSVKNRALVFKWTYWWSL